MSEEVESPEDDSGATPAKADATAPHTSDSGHPTSFDSRALCLRIYRALARAFPAEFKNLYGDDLLQVTEDAAELIWRQRGVLGLMRMVLDIAIRVPVEHAAELRQDLRYGLRMLARSPGFAAVALISLALGIAVATSSFSDLYGMVFRDVPAVASPDELVVLETPTSFPNYERYRERSDLFASAAAYMAPVPLGVSLGDRSERAWGHLVTASYFETLGIRPIMGQFLQDQRGQAPSAVVSYRFWQNQLGSDPAVIGRTLRINGRPCTVVGVGPKDFLGASPMLFVADLWLPVTMQNGVAPELAGGALDRRDAKIFQVIGRLKPGVTLARAAAELDGITRQLEQAYGEGEKNDKRRRAVLLPGGKVIPLPKENRPFLTSFMMILGSLILLIACSNVANMSLARAADRRKEIAVRLALGARRARIVRQLLTESMLLAAGAGTLGFVLAVWMMHFASQVKVPYPMPMFFDVRCDWRALLFTAALTLFTGIAFGLVPALHATRTDLSVALKDGGEVPFRRYRRLGARNLLVIAQVAGSATLLLLTGFIVLGYHRSMGIQTSFETTNLFLFSLDVVRDGLPGEQAPAFTAKLLDRVRALPEVTSASVTETAPMAFSTAGNVSFSTVHSSDPSRVIRSAHKSVVGHGYFQTTGIPVIFGREFRKEDEVDEPRVVLVGEKLGRELWKGEDPLNRVIEISDDETAAFKLGGAFEYRFGVSSKGRRAYQVVGVVRNERESLVAVKAEARPVIYFPLRPSDYAHPSVQGLTLMVRGVPGANVVDAVRREIAALDSRITPFDIRSMSEQSDRLLFPFRMGLWIYGLMGVFGLILSAVGVAGVTAYSVARRRREIGVRIALGARRGNVLALVMKDGTALVAAGSAIGLLFAAAIMRVLSNLISAMARTTSASIGDPVLLTGAPLLLAAMALLACYLPARKSLRIDPVAALRED